MGKTLIALSLAASLPGLPALAHDGDPGGRDVETWGDAAARADARFVRLDTDHDGILTPAERRAARGPGGHRPRAAMARPDRAGHDGPTMPRPDPSRPDPGRDMTAALFRARALDRFNSIDIDHDGRIDPAERAAARDRMTPAPASAPMPPDVG